MRCDIAVRRAFDDRTVSKSIVTRRAGQTDCYVGSHFLVEELGSLVVVE